CRTSACSLASCLTERPAPQGPTPPCIRPETNRDDFIFFLGQRSINLRGNSKRWDWRLEVSSQIGETCPTSRLIPFSIPVGALGSSHHLQWAHKVSVVCVDTTVVVSGEDTKLSE
ncbi:mCG144544, partial [Mus musculus]